LPSSRTTKIGGAAFRPARRKGERKREEGRTRVRFPVRWQRERRKPVQPDLADLFHVVEEEEEREF